MKPHESPRIRKKSIRGDSGDSWPVWNRSISGWHRRQNKNLNLSLDITYALYFLLKRVFSFLTQSISDVNL